MMESHHLYLEKTRDFKNKAFKKQPKDVLKNLAYKGAMTKYNSRTKI